jgi:hypothetical protein
VADLRARGSFPQQLVLHGQLPDLGAQPRKVLVAGIRWATPHGGLAPG